MCGRAHLCVSKLLFTWGLIHILWEAQLLCGQCKFGLCPHAIIILVEMESFLISLPIDAHCPRQALPWLLLHSCDILGAPSPLTSGLKKKEQDSGHAGENPYSPAVSQIRTFLRMNISLLILSVTWTLLLGWKNLETQILNERVPKWVTWTDFWGKWVLQGAHPNWSVPRMLSPTIYILPGNNTAANNNTVGLCCVIWLGLKNAFGDVWVLRYNSDSDCSLFWRFLVSFWYAVGCYALQVSTKVHLLKTQSQMQQH